ncbi:hypothetical protein Vretifemale_14448, partial [Volvox reticuliferus]
GAGRFRVGCWSRAHYLLFSLFMRAVRALPFPNTLLAVSVVQVWSVECFATAPPTRAFYLSEETEWPQGKYHSSMFTSLGVYVCGIRGLMLHRSWPLPGSPYLPPSISGHPHPFTHADFSEISNFPWFSMHPPASSRGIRRIIGGVNSILGQLAGHLNRGQSLRTLTCATTAGSRVKNAMNGTCSNHTAAPAIAPTPTPRVSSRLSSDLAETRSCRNNNSSNSSSTGPSSGASGTSSGISPLAR